MERFKAVIFDMDGVILDSESICDRTWEIAAKEFGIDDSKTVINLCRGMNKVDTSIVLKKKFGSDFDSQKFLERTSILFGEIEIQSGIPLMPYAKEILEYLKPKYRILLASSTRGSTVERQLTNAGLIDYFETRTTGDMVVHSKPDPEIYLMAAASLNLNVEECVAVEDSPNGAASAVAAGIPTILVPDRSPSPLEIQKKCWKICKSLKDLELIL